MPTEPNWHALAYGYRAATHVAEKSHPSTNRPSAAAVQHAFDQGIVAGYHRAIADLQGLVGIETDVFVRDLLAKIDGDGFSRE